MSEKLAPLFTWRSALAESDLGPTTRHVALALSLYMNERGGSAYPGPALLARDTGLHLSTVKEKLAELEVKGWLTCIARGGMKGEARRANEYRAAVPPVALGDPSFWGTGGPEGGDPSPSPRRPVAQDDPNSPENSPENSGAAPDGAPDPRIASLVAGFVEDYEHDRPGKHPPKNWRAAAGRAVRVALADGETPEDIAKCLGVIARESKNPSTLPHVLADMHAGKARR